MNKWSKVVALSFTLTAVGTLSSFAGQDDESKNLDKVAQKIQNTIGLKVSSIADSPVAGLLQIETNQGLFYASADGKYLVHGRVFNVEAGMRNETELALAKMRLAGIDEFADSEIVFKAEDEKYVVNVFTDITCGYCRKLHNQMEEYNKNGITVRYLAFPRGGLASPTYSDMVSVWCAKDKQQALTDAKNGDGVATERCANNVAEQYAFGQRVGVSGTPNIILPDGSLIPGYQPPDALLNALKEI